jgi:pSer/pThr/pTyr-binding forkhead associated (FHA) protein
VPASRAFVHLLAVSAEDTRQRQPIAGSPRQIPLARLSVKNVDRRQTLRGPHFQNRVPEVSLEINRGAAQHRIRRVKPPVYLIGAADDCGLVLGDPLFPAVHTYLYVTGTGVSVRHIGEGPALLVNGLRVENARLADGDRLTLGGYEFTVHIHGVPAGDDDARPSKELAYASSYSESDYDPQWEHLQLLLCDLPAPLRPLSNPAQQPQAPAATYHFYDRRAIA